MEVHPEKYNQNRNFERTLCNLLDIGFSFKYVVSAGVAIPDLFAEKGYEPFKIFDCGGNMQRGVYQNIKPDDGILFSSMLHKQYMPLKNRYSEKIVRSILLIKDSGT